jgi:hypothetical protein
MKKTITKSCLLFYLGALLFQTNLTAADLQADKAPGSKHPSVSNVSNTNAAKTGNPANQVQTIYDIQFNYTPGVISGVSCVYTGTEFWVGTWDKDSVYTLDPTGNITSGFKIPGIGTATSGIRAFAYDGTYLYASANTNFIYRIDPVTKLLVNSISTSFAVRGLAYDSTADGGLGGFWTSNFNTDFYLVNMSGTILETITLAEHTVNSAYGIAFDPYTAGGPYIWAFGQGSSGDSCKLHRISVPGHYHTGAVHDVNADIAGTGSIAGSVSVTWRYDPMHYTLMGCTQGNIDHLFGYELADYTPPAVDASVNLVEFYPAYLQTPIFELSPMNWDVTIGNNGTSTLNDVTTSLVVDDGVSPVFSPVDFHNLGVAVGSTGIANFASYMPPQITQVYNVTTSTNTGAQVDQDATNDDFTYSFEVTDTTMARDNNNPTNRLGLPGGSVGVLGQVFELPAGADATSATFQLNSPDIGDSISVDLYTYSSQPDAIIASSDVYIISGNDTDGVVLTLPFNNGPVFLSPGLYFLGVNQYVTDSNITLATSPFNFRPVSAYFYFEGGTWTPVEDNGGGANPFLICYVLRLNMHNYTLSAGEIRNADLSVYPNPATDQLFISLKSAGEKFDVELFDLVGNKILESQASNSERTTLNVAGIAPGIYLLRTTSNGSTSTMRVAIN